MGRELERLRRPAADNTANSFMNQVIGNKKDVAATVIADDVTIMAYLKRLAGAEITLAKADGAVLNGDDDLFVITGGPIMVMEFVGIVTTIIGGAANMTIQEAVVAPSGDVALSTTVAINTDAKGTSYTFTAAAPSVLTPTTAGGLANVPSVKWLCPIGTIQALGSAAQTGVIAWSMSYKPLSPLSKVVVAD